MADPEDQIPPIPTPPPAIPPVEAAPVAPPPPAAPATPYGAPAAPYAPAGQQAHQPGYPQQYQAQAAGPPRGISLASMICGIAGAALGCCGAGFLPGLAGVILGHLAQKQQPYAKGMWLTGLITGYAGIGLSLIAGLIWIASAFAPLLFLPFAALAG